MKIVIPYVTNVVAVQHIVLNVQKDIKIMPQHVIVQKENTKMKITFVKIVDINVINVKILHLNVLSVKHQDQDFPNVPAHLICMKIQMELVKNVEYNVKNVQDLLIIVNHVLTTENKDLNQIVHAHQINLKHLLVNATIVHTDVRHV